MIKFDRHYRVECGQLVGYDRHLGSLTFDCFLLDGMFQKWVVTMSCLLLSDKDLSDKDKVEF